MIQLIAVDGSVAASYDYDPFGAVISASGPLADINPLRYRGYYYDTESGFYYLQSRYYDPAVRRFINADEYASTGQGILGCNMFAYCGNTPTSNFDPHGKWTMTVLLGGNVTAFLGFSRGIGITFDGEGNIAIQSSNSSPTNPSTTTIGLLDAGVAFQFQYTNKNTYKEIEDVSTYLGFSSGFLKHGGLDVVVDAPVADPNGELTGFQISYGIGIGVDIHVAQARTSTIRVFD